MVAPLAIRGLGRQKLTELAALAGRHGMTPERYVKQLVEQDLEIAREARRMTLSQIAGPGRDVDEEELDRLVEESKSRHHRRSRKKR